MCLLIFEFNLQFSMMTSQIFLALSPESVFVSTHCETQPAWLIVDHVHEVRNSQNFKVKTIPLTLKCHHSTWLFSRQRHCGLKKNGSFEGKLSMIGLRIIPWQYAVRKLTPWRSSCSLYVTPISSHNDMKQSRGFTQNGIPVSTGRILSTWLQGPLETAHTSS